MTDNAGTGPIRQAADFILRATPSIVNQFVYALHGFEAGNPQQRNGGQRHKPQLKMEDPRPEKAGFTFIHGKCQYVMLPQNRFLSGMFRMPASESDKQLVQRIREGQADAWQECIDLFEGRLLAFARSRLTDKSSAEDVVQETFMGFLKALPNYDENTPLESWLFSIAAHKLIDAMRRSGRRPTVPLALPNSDGRPGREPSGTARAASSMLRSHEKSHAESTIVESCLEELIADFKANQSWERLQCVELIFVLGWPNKHVARRLNITEQAVANHKFFVVTKLKEAAKRARLQNVNLDGIGLE